MIPGMSFYTPSAHNTCIHVFSRVSFTGYMNELRQRLSCTYIHELPGVSCMNYYSTGSSTHVYMHVCQVWATRYLDFFNFIAYLRLFPRDELWATDEQARDLSATCEKLRHRDQRVALPSLNIDWVKALGCQSDHRSACRSRGLYIFRYFDVFGPVCVLDNISYFQVPWGLLTMRW